MPETSCHGLHVSLPSGHWSALQAHASRTGESYSAVIRKALADYLDLEHHTLWQLSTSTAVVEGVFGDALHVRDLADHGDFGIGTFEQLDGEGILLDGRFQTLSETPKPCQRHHQDPPKPCQRHLVPHRDDLRPYGLNPKP